MPETQTFGFEYETPQSKPGITLTGDVTGDAPILAEQVDTALSAVDARVAANESTVAALESSTPSDTGWVSLSVSAAGGYDVTSSLYRHWGPVVSIHIDLERTGGTFPANSAGDVTDTSLCTIDTTDARPSQRTYAAIQTTDTAGTVDVNTSGNIDITDMHSSSTIETNDVVRIRVTYFVSAFS